MMYILRSPTAAMLLLLLLNVMLATTRWAAERKPRVRELQHNKYIKKNCIVCSKKSIYLTL